MIYVLLAILGLFVVSAVVFICTHLRPLDDEEIESLAGKRRAGKIRNYFAFGSFNKIVDKEFKKKMESSGTFYNINESLFNFPSIAASLLKYKKHEWIIIGFEKERTLDLLWLNKGISGKLVSSYLSVDEIVNTAIVNSHSSILIFHNHPNSNPGYYDLRKPSDQDIKSAQYYAEELNSEGINLIEFVCERGRFYEYFLSAADNFIPIAGFTVEISSENGLSKLKNLSLHYERCF